MTSHPALLVVDAQQDFLAHPGLQPEAATLTGAIAGLIAWFRARGWPVLHIHTRVAADLSDAMPHWRQAGRGLCVEGTPGAMPPPPLRPAEGEGVFIKRFFDGFEAPDLTRGLREAGVDSVVVAGVHTHACIRATALSAYARGLAVFVPLEAVGSYDPAHAALTLDWLDGRAASCLPLQALQDRLAGGQGGAEDAASVWQHHNPQDWTQLLGTVPVMTRGAVDAAASRLAGWQNRLAAMPIAARLGRLKAWRGLLEGSRARWVEALIRDVGKPCRAAEGEVSYALSLLDNVCRTASDEEAGEDVHARYRPLGTVGIITPWNNPLAMPVSKLAPALAYGNCVLWKPALPGSAIAAMLAQTLHEAGLGEWVELVTGDAATGHALVEAPSVAAISFTGSVAVGQAIARRCGQLLRPVQAELGGNNAAIVLADADPVAVATVLAAEMFSFAGQRCTAIRRVIVADAIYPAFAKALRDAVRTLRTGDPGDAAVHVGPVIGKAHQQAILGLVGEAIAAGASVLTGGRAPAGCPEAGCWIEPTIMADLPDDSPILCEELFGPVVALVRVADLDGALAEHNRGEYGLLGALFTQDAEAQARFLAQAQAGLLLLNEARPAFSAAGPFHGWKASAHGSPEHGRWNRDFYTRVQAVYGGQGG